MKTKMFVFIISLLLLFSLTPLVAFASDEAKDASQTLYENERIDEPDENYNNEASGDSNDSIVGQQDNQKTSLLMATDNAETARVYIDAESSDIDSSGEGWEYEGTTHTLTLYGYSGDDIVVYADDVKIILRSKNTVNVDNNCTHGIRVYGDLTISGSGSFNFTAIDSRSEEIGIYSQGDLTINGGKINIDYTQCSNNSNRNIVGIQSDGDLSINGDSKIEVANPNIALAYEQGVYAAGNLFLNNSGEVSITGGNVSFRAGGVAKFSGEGKVSTGPSNSSSFGSGPAVVGGQLVFDGCKDAVFSSCSTCFSCNASASDTEKADVIFNNSNVEMTGSSGLSIKNSVDINDSYVHLFSSNITLMTSNSARYGFNITGDSNVELFAGNKNYIASPSNLINYIDLSGGRVFMRPDGTYLGNFSLGEHTFLLDKTSYNINESPEGNNYSISSSGTLAGVISGTFVYADDEESITPNIITNALKNGFVDEEYSESIDATGITPITWNITEGALPDGLSLNKGTGTIEGIPERAGTFTFTITATNGAGTISKDFEMEIAHPKNDKPSATFKATGYDEGMLGSVTKKMKYSVDGGNTWNDISGSEIKITNLDPKNPIKVYQPADATSSDSPIQVLEITRSAQPDSIWSTNCTGKNRENGTITGTTSDMEYKKDTDQTWTDCEADTIADLSAGTYFVRVKANGMALSSESVEVEIQEYDVELTGEVSISGKAVYGYLLSATVNDTNNTGDFGYQWHRDGEEIVGASESTYRITEDDVGKVLSCTVSSSNETGYIKNNTDTITKAGADDITVLIDNASYIFDGTPKEPRITVKDNNDQELSIDTDYVVEYRNNINPGTGVIQVSLVGKRYSGEISKEFAIICEHINKKHVEAIDATCLKNGNIEYWLCPDCNNYFRDDNCSTSIAKDGWIVKATGHKWNEGVVTKKATCTAVGTKTITCSKCDETKTETIAALGHSWKHYKKAAGLLKNGTEYDYCTVCKVKKNVKTLTGYATYYVKSFKVAKAKKAFTAKWAKQSAANQKKFNGYQIRYSTKSNMSGAKYVTAGKSSKSKKVSKLKKKTKYYVQVRTYTKSGGKTFYSKWSAKKSVKTK